MVMRQAGVQLTSTNEQNPLISQQQQQHEIMNTPIDSDDVNARRLPNLPPLDLLTGPRDDYLKFCLPLYEASIKCDWKAAKAILEKRPELVRYSITENGETALHVAASAKVPNKKGKVFVKNLVDLMEKEDLALENENFNTALYLAAAAGNLETIKIMVEKNSALLVIPGGEGKMLPLYAAAVSGNYHVVMYLYKNSNDLSDVAGWSWTDVKRCWLLEKCVENDMFDVALQIVKKNPELGLRGSVLGILAQKPYAFAQPDPLLKRMANYTFGDMSTCTFSDMSTWVLEKLRPGGQKARKAQALQLLRFILDDIVKRPKNEIDSILIIRGPNAIKQANKPVSDQALELQKLISEHIVNMHVQTQNIIEQDSKSTNVIKGDQAVQLEKVISEHITKMQVKTRNIIRGAAAKDTLSSEALFTAAEMGNTVFLVELIRRFPDIMWKVNDNNQTIFHIAVENRHEGIYSMLYEIGYMKDSITSLVDENGNNMLHLVAKIAKKKKLEQVPGVIFQMQRELKWFKEVEPMINPSCRERKNNDGLTAHELFTKEHEDLLAQSVMWVKSTANQCMVVAALVATIAFAAAITVPGGYDQDNGIPIFYRDSSYTDFIMFDALSLFASSACILSFITILTSRFAEHDFLFSIPLKFIIFLSALFYSIASMIYCFSDSFFIIYHKEKTWIPNTIWRIAILFLWYPVFLLLNKYLMWAYGFSSNLQFKPGKHVLYYKNPVL